jgi:hypothetical protein
MDCDRDRYFRLWVQVLAIESVLVRAIELVQVLAIESVLVLAIQR